MSCGPGRLRATQGTLPSWSAVQAFTRMAGRPRDPAGQLCAGLEGAAGRAHDFDRVAQQARGCPSSGTGSDIACLRAPHFRGRIPRRCGNSCRPMYRQRTTEDRSSPLARTQAPALIRRSLLRRFPPRRPALLGHARAVARSLRLVRACRACTFACHRPLTCTGLDHEPTTQPAIVRQRQPRSSHPTDARREPTQPHRPLSTGEPGRGGGDSRLPLRDPGREPSLDDGRGPAPDLDAGVRGTRPMASRRARRRGERPVIGGQA